jgi:hypothetical protein
MYIDDGVSNGKPTMYGVLGVDDDLNFLTSTKKNATAAVGSLVLVNQ